MIIKVLHWLKEKEIALDNPETALVMVALKNILDRAHGIVHAHGRLQKTSCSRLPKHESDEVE